MYGGKNYISNQSQTKKTRSPGDILSHCESSGCPSAVDSSIPGLITIMILKPLTIQLLTGNLRKSNKG